MPTGKHLSKEEKTNIIRLKDQGIAPKAISIRTGIHVNTIYTIISEGRNENTRRDRSKN